MPCVIGGYRNRDSSLLLRTSFAVAGGNRTLLRIDSLDPYGEVWVNGTKLLCTEGFMEAKLDITEHVIAGASNMLSIRVFPRAPEMYYHWHRNNDNYHGWFAGRVYVEEIGDVEVSRPITRTRQLLSERGAEIEVEAEISHAGQEGFDGYVRIRTRRWFPIEEETYIEQLIQPVDVEPGDKKSFTCRLVMEADLWCPESPVLYEFVVAVLDSSGKIVDEDRLSTGTRTVDQTGEMIRVNGKPTMLNGALRMQFLPPYEDIPNNHVCPSTEQIVWQMLMIKQMHGNTARLHMLGYGSNDPRYADVCDQLGMMLIWTTRLIDALETIIYPGEWRMKQAYRDQVLKVINHPSIVIWEGSNEFHGGLQETDKMYDAYVDLFETLDPTRLLSPCSHLYYGGGFYGDRHQYYNDNGTLNQDGQLARSSSGWVSPKVVRSSHPYILLNGYGETWDRLRKQDWHWQEELLDSTHHAYLITEFAVTADPNWERYAGEVWHQVESYEKYYEDGSFGRRLSFGEWRVSQAF